MEESLLLLPDIHDITDDILVDLGHVDTFFRIFLPEAFARE